LANVVICDACGKTLRLSDDHYVIKSYSKGPATKAGLCDLCVDLCLNCHNKLENYIKNIKSSK
jgi:hypothetical protein